MTFSFHAKGACWTVLLLIAGACGARAADIPRDMPRKAQVPVYSWAGFYIGANAGYSYGPWDSTTTVGVFPGAASTFDPKVKGWLGGVQLGYNWLSNRLLLGFEGDFQITGEKASAQTTATFGPIPFADSTLTATATTSNEWKFPWFATIRGRVGYTADDWLLYGTGGAAVGRAQFSTTTAATLVKTAPNPFTLSASTTDSEAKTRWGWALGAGVEKMLGSNFSAKFEYLYLDFGSYTFLAGSGSDTSVRLRDHILRLGLNYRFNGPLAVRY
jgi:outer membrane immunogenic protein